MVWAGGDPGALFRSADWGQSWEQVDSLTLHPTRPKWMPGAGGMCLHSIQSLGGGKMSVAISAAGAFRSTDGGAAWEPYNQGVRADFQPEKYPEVGQCVHKLLAHPKNPEMLFQQNHCGVYRGKFSGKKWTDCCKGLPIAFRIRTGGAGGGAGNDVHGAHRIGRIPLQPEGGVAGRPQPGGGRTWKLLTRGLPQKNAHVTVLREAMSSDPLSPAGVYFGTSTGVVYYTRNAGEKWDILAENLPPVYSVTVAAA